MKTVCVCTYVCVCERGSICVHINICSLHLFNSPLQLCKYKSFPCCRGGHVIHWCCSVCLRIKIWGEFVVPREEAVSHRGEEKGRRAELCYSPPPGPLPLTSVLRSVIFVPQGELTHTNTHNTCSLFSLPVLGSRGQTVSWELESQ